MRRICLLILLCATILGGCSAGATPSRAPTPAPSAAPTAAPAAEISLDVQPPEAPPEIRVAIPGSRYCFLVVADAGATAGPLTISATATKADVVEIRPVELPAGAVGEVCVVADATTTETTGSVVITATSGAEETSVTRSLKVFPMLDERAADAKPYFDLWVAWLAAEHPELGITADTAWEPVFVSTLLVVSHYSYWSEDWEMMVAWHNMIPPYDWTEVHLRRRGVDAAPSLAFKIDSVSGATEPYGIEPVEVVVR